MPMTSTNTNTNTIGATGGEELRAAIAALHQEVLRLKPLGWHAYRERTRAARRTIGAALSALSSPEEAGWSPVLCQKDATKPCGHDGSGNESPAEREGRGTQDCPLCGVTAAAFQIDAQAFQASRIAALLEQAAEAQADLAAVDLTKRP